MKDVMGLAELLPRARTPVLMDDTADGFEVCIRLEPALPCLALASLGFFHLAISFFFHAAEAAITNVMVHDQGD